MFPLHKLITIAAIFKQIANSDSVSIVSILTGFTFKKGIGFPEGNSLNEDSLCENPDQYRSQ